MQDLNDLSYFVHVVDHGGFAPAAAAMGIPKSTLSRRIARLETALGVRLLQRSTRRVTVTELGKSYYQRCRAMLIEAEAAQELIDQSRSEPCGLVRVTCPVAMLDMNIGAILADYLARHPRVEMQLDATNRRVDVLAEGVDIAIRVRPPPLEDSELVLRVLGERRQCLVANPDLLAAHAAITHPDQLDALPSIGLGTTIPECRWRLLGPEGAEALVEHHPRLMTRDMFAVRRAAVAGVGVAQLPTMMMRQELADGALMRVLPDWAPRPEIIHAVFPARRGLLPSVRALIDDLVRAFEALDDD